METKFPFAILKSRKKKKIENTRDYKVMSHYKHDEFNI